MELVKQAPLNLSYFSFAATLLLTMACSNHDKVKPPVAIAPGAVDSEASSENGKPAADQMSLISSFSYDSLFLFRQCLRRIDFKKLLLGVAHRFVL